MPAPHADVFVMTVPRAAGRIGVVTQKAREGMPDVRLRSVLAQDRRVAAQADATLLTEGPIVDHVAPDRAPRAIPDV